MKQGGVRSVRKDRLKRNLRAAVKTKGTDTNALRGDGGKEIINASCMR